jgi:hypothetical protein
VYNASGAQGWRPYLDVILRVAPITLGIEVAQEDGVLQALLDASHGTSDLAGHKGGTCSGQEQESARIV